MTGAAVEPNAKWVYRTGGVSALALGGAYLLVTGLYIPMGAPPGGAEARLSYTAANLTAWRAILWLSVLTDFLFVPVALALYLALKGINRNAMLLATAGLALFAVLDLAVTWTNYAALIQLGGKYAKEVSEVRRAALVTAAEYPAAVVESNVLFVYNTLVPAVAILITGWVMRKGMFRRGTAHLGLATGILGMVSVGGSFVESALSVTIIAASVLTTVWILLVGRELFVLGR
jgi:hypothetical protein